MQKVSSLSPDQALAQAEQALAVDPDNVDRQIQVGILYRELGRLTEAQARFEAILKITPKHLQARFELGQTLMKRERFDDAAKHLARVAKAMDTHAEVLAVYGTALGRAGQLGKAVLVLEKARTLEPGNIKATANLAAVYSERGDVDKAIALYREQLQRMPDSARAHYNLAACLSQASYHDEALTEYERALALDPDNGDVHNNIGNLLAFKGLYDRAALHLKRATALRPNDPYALFNLGQAYLQAQDYASAEDCYRTLMARWPDEVIGYVGLATALQTQGRFGDAVSAIDILERATGVTPKTLWLRAQNGPDGLNGIDPDTVETLAKARNTNDDDAAKVQFVLARLRHTHKDYDGAFKAYATGNALRDKAFAPTYDATNENRLAGVWAQVFTPAFFDHYKGAGLHGEDRPIFVVGMPRSGTTLIEQILSAHPAVAGAGELSTVNGLATDVAPHLTGGKPYPEAVTHLTYDQVNTLAAAYIEEALRIGGDATAQRIVDKMPTNFWHLGLIALMLPNARVVHCRRDPMATGYSIFQQNFQGAHEYAYDLEKIGRRINAYRAVMAHWETALPLPILTVDYEALVTDTETQARRLVDFAGLAWDPTVMDFNQTDQNVHTASQWQVRQPIYTSAVDAWKRYERHLEPLRRILESPS